MSGRILIVGLALLFVVSSVPLYASMAYDTQVATPQGNGDVLEPIQNFEIGDRVFALEQDDDEGLQWGIERVKFSSGTGPGGRTPAMVYISFDEVASFNRIVVTPDHLFLVGDAGLTKVMFKRAERLVPGVDVLVSYEGKAVPIKLVSLGEYSGGIHNIATSTNLKDEWEGHLIITNGIISADYLLQIKYSSGQ